MSKFANIKLIENYALDPSFEELIQTLALRHSLYTFGVKGLDSDTLEYISGESPKFKPKPVDTVDGTRFLSHVKVHSGSEELGYVSMEGYYLNGTRVPQYTLSSWRLGERENSRTTTLKTTKLNVALRTFKKFFVPRAMLELYKTARVEVQHGFNKCLTTLMRPIDHGQLSPNPVDLERYIYLTVNNLSLSPELQDGVVKAFSSEKYANAMAKWVLARDMKDTVLHTVVAHNGGYLYWNKISDEEGELQHLAYEDMPESLKNNLAVLQLCKDNELVRDVGYRLNSGLLLVTAA